MRSSFVAALALTVLGAGPAVATSNAADPVDKNDGQSRSTVFAPGERAEHGSLADFRARLSSRRGTTDVRRIAAPDAPPPVFTAPDAGATVGGTVPVSATSEAASVVFAVGSWQQTVPVVDGVASTAFDSRGLSGARTITATPCDDLGCGTGATQSVTVANPAIAVTQPLDGAVVGTSVVASVNATGGAVRFFVDNSVVGEDSTAPYDLTIDTGSLGDGAHVLSAVQCDAALLDCDGAVAPDVSFTVLTQLFPYVTSVSPSPFSPNGDGRRDTTTVRYSLDRQQSVTWRVVDGSGATMRGPVHRGSESAGSHSFTWTGKDNGGTALPTGSYTVRLTTSRVVGSETVHGVTERSVRVDVTPAKVSNRSASPATFYPVRDDYKDTVSLRGTINEATSSVKVDVLNSSGSVVRTIDLGSRSAGVYIHPSWNGRKADGSLRPAGTYYFRVRTQDLAGNRATSGKVSFALSHKKLVASTATKTVTPQGSATHVAIGYCSDIFKSEEWSGGLEYLSLYYYDIDACEPTEEGDDLAIARHRVVLPTAVKYGAIRVDTYGHRDVPGIADSGAVVYENRYGDFSNAGAYLAPALDWHTGDTVSGANYVQGRTFAWWAGTVDYNWYDIKSFRVKYTYYVLG